MRKKRREIRIWIGGASIILIALIITLSVFSVQSMKASNDELNLAKENRKKIQAYYQADSEAETMLMQINEVLKNYYKLGRTDALKNQIQDILGSQGKVQAKTDKTGQITYEIKIDEMSVLEVFLSYDIDSENGSFYELETWVVKSQEESRESKNKIS